jgi:hypothetical protein
MIANANYHIFAGFDPASPTLSGPRGVEGTCLRGLGFSPGRCLTFMDANVPPRDGDIVHLALQHKNPTEPHVHVCKKLQWDQWEGEFDWWIVSEEGAHRYVELGQAIRTMEVMVAMIHFDDCYTDWQVAHFRREFLGLHQFQSKPAGNRRALADWPGNATRSATHARALPASASR